MFHQYCLLKVLLHCIHLLLISIIWTPFKLLVLILCVYLPGPDAFPVVQTTVSDSVHRLARPKLIWWSSVLVLSSHLGSSDALNM